VWQGPVPRRGGVAGIGFVLAAGPDTKSTVGADSIPISIP